MQLVHLLRQGYRGGVSGAFGLRSLTVGCRFSKLLTVGSAPSAAESVTSRRFQPPSLLHQRDRRLACPPPQLP